MTFHFSRLDRLEAEAIHIMREVAAIFERPAMLYSIGKDSSVSAIHMTQMAHSTLIGKGVEAYRQQGTKNASIFFLII